MDNYWLWSLLELNSMKHKVETSPERGWCCLLVVAVERLAGISDQPSVSLDRSSVTSRVTILKSRTLSSAWPEGGVSTRLSPSLSIKQEVGAWRGSNTCPQLAHSWARMHEAWPCPPSHQVNLRCHAETLTIPLCVQLYNLFFSN